MRRAPILTVIAVAALLSIARDVVIPIALAGLLSFVLTPLVSRLERWRVPRVVATVFSLLLFMAASGAVLWLVADQAVDVARDLPHYKQNIRAKLASLKQGGDGGRIGEATRALDELKREIAPSSVGGREPAPAPSGTASPAADTTTAARPPAPPREEEEPGEALRRAREREQRNASAVSVTAAFSTSPATPTAAPAAGTLTAIVTAPAPVPVVIAEGRPSLSEIVREFITPALGPLGTGFLMMLLSAFMLVQRDDLRDRLLRLVGPEQLGATTLAIDDGARRVSRYLFMQSVINAGAGAAIAAGLLLIGVPNALLCGLIAMLLRFVPYVGIWIAASLPCALAFGYFPGWTQPALTLGLFIVTELTAGNVFEPWLLGAHTGLSPFAIVVSALFWTWIWGPIGLLLSIPLTSIALVAGRHVPRLRFLAVLLGDAPPLSREERLYQRLIAKDLDGALDIVLGCLDEDHGPVELYDRVLVPLLRHAEDGRLEGDISPSRERFLLEEVRVLVEERGIGEAAPGAEQGTPCPVLCVPASEGADATAAVMLARLLRWKGIAAEVDGDGAAPRELLQRLSRVAPSVVCICAVLPRGLVRARARCRLIRATHDLPPIVVCAFGPEVEHGRVADELRGIRDVRAATTFERALAEVRSIAGVPASEGAPEGAPEAADAGSGLSGSEATEPPRGPQPPGVRLDERPRDARRAPPSSVSDRAPKARPDWTPPPTTPDPRRRRPPA